MSSIGSSFISSWTISHTEQDGTVQSPETTIDYIEDLGNYVATALSKKDLPEIARSHVHLRASSVLLIYTVAEVLCA